MLKCDSGKVIGAIHTCYSVLQILNSSSNIRILILSVSQSTYLPHADLGESFAIITHIKNNLKTKRNANGHQTKANSWASHFETDSESDLQTFY